MIRKLSAGLAVALLAAASSNAYAATQVYTYDTADAAAGLPAGPYGTVTVDDTGGVLNFLVQLASGFHFNQNNNANHHAFAFSLAGDPNVSISGLTSGFAAFNPTSGTSVTQQPFGVFYTGVNCTPGDSACTGGGYNGGYAGSLSFTAAVAGQTLSLASLVPTGSFGGTPTLLSSDVVSSTGATGNVGTGLRSAVPEPTSWAMMLVGFAGIGFAMRRQKAAANVKYNFA